MIKAFASVVFVWGLLLTVIPWFVGPDSNTATDMIISGLGLITIGSAFYMWSKAGSQPC